MLFRSPGTQRIQLSQYNLELRPKIEYRWRITVVDDSGGRTARGIAGGTISRVEMWGDLDARLRRTPATNHVGVLAEEGLWYDAIALLSSNIDKAPSDRTTRQFRAGLLNQVGLTEASQFEADQK